LRTCTRPVSCARVTIVNGINNEQVGRIIKFALDNPKRLILVLQPVSFTGRAKL
jgi:uncharacterized radical SAM superfamily Fe-S cluster-containing enzyme